MEPLWSHYARRSSQAATMEPLWPHYGELATPKASGPRAVGRWMVDGGHYGAPIEPLWRPSRTTSTMEPLWAHCRASYAKGSRPPAAGPSMRCTMELLWNHYARRSSQTATMERLWAHYGALSTPKACVPRAVGP